MALPRPVVPARIAHVLAAVQTNRHIEERNQLQGRVENLEAELQVAQTKQFMAVKKECARCCKDLVADVKDQVSAATDTITAGGARVHEMSTRHCVG
eukprot:SAG31_NODE_2230_length_6144_cov_3.629115_6_plen_97_part_00